MMAGTTNMGGWFPPLIVIFGIACSCATEREVAERYWTGESNIVAAVSAYEFTANLPSGENISYYSTNIMAQYTNSYAVLFYVVSPKKYAGKYFRLKEHETMPLSSNFPPPIHHLGKLYYFQFSDTSDDFTSDVSYWFGLCSDDLFSIPMGGEGRLSVGKTTSNIYYSSISDAVQALHDLKKEQIKLEEQMSSLSNKIEKAQANGIDVKKDPKYRWLRGQFLNLKMGRLPSINYKQKEIKMQIEKLKQIEK